MKDDWVPMLDDGVPMLEPCVDKIEVRLAPGSVQLYSDCIKNVLESSRPLFFCRMFWNVPDNRLKRRRLIEDDILSNPRQIHVYLPWLEPS